MKTACYLADFRSSENVSNSDQNSNFLVKLKPEAVVQRCSLKNAFLRTSQIRRKMPVPGSLFLLKLHALGLALAQVFSYEFREIFGSTFL